MLLYRSSLRTSEGEDYSASYTATVDGVLYASSAFVIDDNDRATFNNVVEIGNNIVQAIYTFNNCKNFNQNIIIPQRVIDCRNMFHGCTNFGQNIYIKGNTNRTINTVNMLQSMNNSLRKNIWFNSSLNAQFNKSDNNSLVGNSITWTPMTNGFYNEVYNIYCYSNYSG